MKVWTFYLTTSVIAVFINALHCMYLSPVNTTERSFTSESGA